MKLSGSDLWFFGGMAGYLAIGLPNLYYRFVDVDVLVLIWIFYLLIGAVIFKLWRTK